MALDLTSPADTEYLSTAPGKIRENDRAIVNDKIVNAGKLQDLTVGNGSGNIPVSNGTLNVGLNAEKLNGQPGAYYSPSTHVHSVATTTANGFMANTDKTKLDGIAAGAEVNQSAFSNVKVGTTTIQADTATDVLEMKAGTGITLTPDATNDAVTIAVTQDGHSHLAATTSAAGFISAADKAKLDGITTGAEVNQNAFATIVAGGVSAVADAKQDTFTINAGGGITITGDATNDACSIALTPNGHTHTDATTSAAGFMTAAMVGKLNGIATGAQTNQNAFSNVLVGTTTVAADSATDTLELVAGANITLTPDATNDKVTIASTYSYAHPTGDGNLHVPATGTTNNTKVLKAGSTAGSAAWGTVTAAETTFTPITGVTATTVQAAIAELETAKLEASEVVTTAAANKVLKLNASGQLPANSTTATKLATARTINGVSFDGSSNITVYDSSKLPLTGGTISGDLNVTGTLTASNWASGLWASSSTFTASSQGAWSPSGNNSGGSTITALTQSTGLGAGTYSLQKVIQELITRSHIHGSTTVATDNCNCGY